MVLGWRWYGIDMLWLGRGAARYGNALVLIWYWYGTSMLLLW